MTEPPTPPDPPQRPELSQRRALSQRMGMLLTALQAIVAARGGRDRAVTPLVTMAWKYLARLRQRFEALARRVQAGDPSLTAPRAPRAASAQPPEPPPEQPPEPRPRPPRLPRDFAWMVKLTQPAACIGWDLRMLLAEPEFAAFLAAAPQAGRLLRPLCRALGISRDPDLPAALFKTPGLPRLSRRRPPPPAALPAPLPEPDRRTVEWPADRERTRADILSCLRYRNFPA